ncbi:hypothetical protein QNI16_38030 [Cytophagaceae bacterium YF14B1]|uniref:Uncharacterized protein n=1 Tax=Xanthocytophaga flava TaxID=3048013 RepID=A0AAE3R000_9BACT|nr:hypothetical protein [Xanthocytophaga flavus]MDJ1486341.1 hypothetical protein [Xanthocytophaga flavus]
MHRTQTIINIYSNTDNNTIVIKEKSACAQDVKIKEGKEVAEKTEGTKNENFLGDAEMKTTFVDDVVVTPPQVPPAPSPKKGGNVDKAKNDFKATQSDSCSMPCREAYLRQFVAYKWIYGRDDKFLKQVLMQIRYKIAVQWQQPDLNLAEIPDEPVIHSFRSFLEKIPAWHRDNGYTTPQDLMRNFEKYYTAIKAGNGGGVRSSFAPAREHDEETVRLLLRYRD